jgi:hypothetical protein
MGPCIRHPIVTRLPASTRREETGLRLSRRSHICVSDIWACYKQWGDKGAFFLTEPLDNHGWEWRCYMRDPDGYLIEIGRYTQVALNYLKSPPIVSTPAEAT